MEWCLPCQKAGFSRVVLWYLVRESLTSPCLPHDFYTEICKAWSGMVRYGVVPTKLKNRHLTLKQVLHCSEDKSDLTQNELIL